MVLGCQPRHCIWTSASYVARFVSDSWVSSSDIDASRKAAK